MNIERVAKNSKIIVITPVYEDALSLANLVDDLELEYQNKVLVVAIDDGSIKSRLDASLFSQKKLKVVVLKLKRNVGHQKAIAVGMSYCATIVNKDHKILIMDSDGEDTPSSSKILLKALDNPEIDIAVAERKSRIESLRFKIFYVFYKLLFSLFTGQKISFGNFMALKSHSIHRLISMSELSTHIAATVIASKLRIQKFAIDRGSRYEGTSKMNFVGLVLHGFRGLMIFNENVLIRVGIICGIISLLSVLGIVIAIFLKTVGFSTPGWFSIALGILVIIFLQTGAITLISLLHTGVSKKTQFEENNYKLIIEDIDISE